MDPGQLFVIPQTKEEIRQRVSSCLDYFVAVRSKELGVNPTDLRQVLPGIIFFDELDEPPSRSALGAFNGGEYIVKINEQAVFTGKISVEMCILHEYTHALDELLMHLYLDLDDCMAWLRNYTVHVELPRFHNPLLIDYETMMFAERPQWKGQELLAISHLLKQILKQPAQFFELDQWRCSIGIKQVLFNDLMKLKGCKKWDVESAALFLRALHFQWRQSYYAFSSQLKLNDLQQAAYIQLRKCKPSKLNVEHLIILMSLHKGAVALHYGLKPLNKNHYFDLSEEFQLPYLCAEGEIRARREASRLLLQAIDSERLLSPSFEQERYTLRCSIQLEDALLKWKQLRDSTEPKLFEKSEERYRLETLIQQTAPHARTHKLIRRFYANEELYLFCREWNERRAEPYSAEALEQLAKLTGQLPGVDGVFDRRSASEMVHPALQQA